MNKGHYIVMYRHRDELVFEEKEPKTFADLPKPWTQLDLWGNGFAHSFLEDVCTNLYQAIHFDGLFKKKGTHEVSVINMASEPNMVVTTLKVWIV